MKKRRNKKVILIGATGLIGGHLLDLLKKDNDITKIKLLVRRPFETSDSKVTAVVIDFEDQTTFRNEFEGYDSVFCAVGTTNKKVKGNKTAYEKIDYDIPVNAAKFASQAGCKQFAVVSSYGADSSSANFYLKLKGRVEDAIQQLAIPNIFVFRPSFLIGNRNEFRLGELLGITVMKPLSFLMPSKMKPIEARTVAKAMLYATKKDETGFHIFHFEDMQKLIQK